MSSGTAEIWLEFGSKIEDCVQSIEVEAYGYDDSWFGGGARVYLYNWETWTFDLLPDERIGSEQKIYLNAVANPVPYMICGAKKCYVNAKVTAGAWDNTHLLWSEIWLYMSNI